MDCKHQKYIKSFLVVKHHHRRQKGISHKPLLNGIYVVKLCILLFICAYAVHTTLNVHSFVKSNYPLSIL